MTSVLDPNVHNLAVNGTFDDCQDFLKALFGDADIKKTHKLAAINSINWARKVFPNLIQALFGSFCNSAKAYIYQVSWLRLHIISMPMPPF